MQRKVKITIFSILGFVVVVVAGLAIATPIILNNMANKQVEQLQAQLQEEISAAALAINVGLFPTIKDLGDSYQITLAIPEVQALEFDAEVVDNKLRLNGKLTVTVEKDINGYHGSSSTSRDFSFSLGLVKPVDGSKIVTKREKDKIVAIVPIAK